MHSESLFDEVAELVCLAVAECVDLRSAENIRSKKGSVIRGRWQSSSDFVSSCAKDIFHHAGRVTLGEGGRRRKRKTTYERLDVVATSSMGLERRRTYTHPRELAESIVLALPEDRRENLLAGTCVNEKDGSILLCTKIHLEWHALFGRLPCLVCGAFYKGIRGLRMHQVLVHGIDYETAQREAIESRFRFFRVVHQLCMFLSPRTHSNHLTSRP